MISFYHADSGFDFNLWLSFDYQIEANEIFQLKRDPPTQGTKSQVLNFLIHMA